MRDITTPAEWVTAIATSLAVIVALGVALSEPWRQRRREERQQARAVHAWTAPANFNPDSPHTRDFHTYGWAVHLFNGSNRPVFDLSAVFRARGASGKETSTPVLPAPYQPLLPTGDAAQFWYPGRHMLDHVPLEPLVGLGIVSFSFTDADSRRWTVENGKLKRS